MNSWPRVASEPPKKASTWKEGAECKLPQTPSPEITQALEELKSLWRRQALPREVLMQEVFRDKPLVW